MTKLLRDGLVVRSLSLLLILSISLLRKVDILRVEDPVVKRLKGRGLQSGLCRFSCGALELVPFMQQLFRRNLFDYCVSLGALSNYLDYLANQFYCV